MCIYEYLLGTLFKVKKKKKIFISEICTKCFMDNATHDWDIRETLIWLECTLDAWVNTKRLLLVFLRRMCMSLCRPCVCNKIRSYSLVVDLPKCLPYYFSSQHITLYIRLLLTCKFSRCLEMTSGSFIFLRAGGPWKSEGDPWPYFLPDY